MFHVKHLFDALVVTTLLLLVVTCAAQDGGEPMDLGTQKWLLYDDYLFAQKSGFETTPMEAVRDPQPVLAPEMPWEQGTVWWHNTVLVDDAGVIRLYYCAQSADMRPRLCLATSTDGVTFERPSLGVVEFEGSTDNNIVFEPDLGSHYAGTVFIDPTAPEAERYKLITDGALMEHDEGVPAYKTIRGAFSPDGIHWQYYPQASIMPWYTDTQNVAMWDDRLGRYVAYVRYNEGYVVEDRRISGRFGYRCVGRSESDSFTDFPAPQKVLDPAPAGRDMAEHQGWMDLYNPMVLQWPGTRNYLMMPSPFYHYGLANKLDVKLATSRDGIEWALLPGTFVRLSRTGAWDSERIYMAAGQVPMGDETLLYYAGYDLDHSGHHKPYPPQFGAIGVARIGLDRFVAQKCGEDGGEIVTRPFAMPANRLLMNFDTSAGGHVKIEFLDEAGEGIASFSGAGPCGPMCGNSVRRLAHLRNRAQHDFTALVGRTVRLRITGRNCRLYSLEFADAADLQASGLEID